MNERHTFSRELLNTMAYIPPGMEPGETASCLRREHERLTREIRTRFSGPWRPGRGRELAGALSLLKETVIRRICDALVWDQGRIAIVALGGLGRGEVAPGSDLDLLVLHAPGAAVAQFVRGFLYILWDGGFEVTASTRTVADSLSHASSDVTFFTALLQCRLLAGSSGLYENLQRRFSRRVRRLGRPLISEWLEEERAAANGRPPLYIRQPHLKKRPGGLRAVQALEWCAAITQGKRKPSAPGVALTDSETRRLETARDYLLYLRSLLHFDHGIREDTLALEAQQTLASAMDLRGGGIEAVRSLMRYYYKQVRIIHRLLYRTVEHAWLRGRPWRRGRLARANAASGLVRRGVLHVPAGLPPSPAGAFRILERLAGEPLDFAASAVAYLERCAAVWQPGDTEDFLTRWLTRLLSLPRSAQSLWALHFSGLLSRLFPVFLPIRLLYMYNPVHLWPVDVHSIAAAAALERICTGGLPEGLPDFMSALTETAALYRDKAWVLKLALLLHDTGKGFPGDHAKNGVEVAARFLDAAGIQPQYRTAIIFLIEHHLLISTAVRRRDTADPAVVDDLAAVFILSPYPEEYLDLLSLLTFADVWATNPKNFTGYFALTFTRVYQRVRDVILQRPREAAGAGSGRFTEEQLARPGFASFLEEMGERYAERHEPDTILQDCILLSTLPAGKFHLELGLSPEVVKVKVFAWDRPGLFALLTGVLSLNGAAIVRADIHTRRDRVLDEFAVTHIFESDSGSVSAAQDGERWKAVLLRDLYKYQHEIERLSGDLAVLKNKTRVLGERFSYPPRVTLSPRRGEGARLEVSGHDRPALLFDLAWAMARSGVYVNGAFIDTTGWLAHDVFDVCYQRPDQVDESALVRLLEGVLSAQTFL